MRQTTGDRMKSFEIEPGIWHDESDYGESLGYSTNDSQCNMTLNEAKKHKSELKGTEFEVME